PPPALAAGAGDAVLLAVCPDHGLAVQAGRRDDGGDGGTRRGPREEGEAERLHARPRAPGEALVTAVDLGQALVQDQAYGDVEPHETRHRGRVLSLALCIPTTSSTTVI